MSAVRYKAGLRLKGVWVNTETTLSPIQTPPLSYPLEKMVMLRIMVDEMSKHPCFWWDSNMLSNVFCLYTRKRFL